jgi:hypothetical protein
MLRLLLDAESPNALIEDSMVYDLSLPGCDPCGMHTEACEQIVFTAGRAPQGSQSTVYEFF